MAAHFSEASVKFLKGLKKHNDRDWFDARKPVYEAELKAPMLEVIEAINAGLAGFAPEHVRPPQKCMMRIYRDIRFSKNKQPYKTNLAAWWARQGLEKTSGGGFYFQFSPEEVIVAGGAYMPEKDQVLAIRRYLLEHHEEYRKLLKSKKMQATMTEFEPIKMTRPPKGFAADTPALDLILQRQWGRLSQAAARDRAGPRAGEGCARTHEARGAPGGVAQRAAGKRSGSGRRAQADVLATLVPWARCCTGYAERMRLRGQSRCWRRVAVQCAPLALGCCLGCCLGLRAAAQSLPAGTATQPALGSVTGRVTDRDGGGVAGARVTLNGSMVTVTDEAGGYTFAGVPAGPFSLAIAAEGFVSAAAAGVVRAAQATDVPAFALGAASSSDVTVTTSMDEVGKAEVKVEETQRLLGALPNFFVAYDWNAPPLKAKQKFELSYKSTFDPVTIMISEISAGVQEADNQLSGYGKGGNGFVKRSAANQANVAIGTFTGGYLFPLLLRQDPRYFYMGSEHGSIKKRIFYALSTGFITRGDNGKWQPNYSSVLGDLATGAAANAYYPASDRHGWTTVIDAGLLGAALDGAGNLVQEFLYKRLTPHAPNYPAAGQLP